MLSIVLRYRYERYIINKFFYLCNFLYSIFIQCIFLHCISLHCNFILFQYTHYLTSEESIYSNQSGRCPEPHQELVPGPICSVAQNQARGRSVIFLLTQAYSFQQCQGRCKLINQPLTLIYIFFLTSYSFYVMI